MCRFSLVLSLYMEMNSLFCTPIEKDRVLVVIKGGMTIF